MEPLHLCDVTRLEVEPTPLPRPYEKPELLAGIWFDGVTGDFADVLKADQQTQTSHSYYLSSSLAALRRHVV